MIYSLERERYGKRRVILYLFDDWQKALRHLKTHIMFQKGEELICYDVPDWYFGSGCVLTTNKAKYYIVERTLSER